MLLKSLSFFLLNDFMCLLMNTFIKTITNHRLFQLQIVRLILKRALKFKTKSYCKNFKNFTVKFSYNS